MADNFIIGPSAGKSQVQQFHDFLLSDIGNIPLATQWVLQIDKLPDILSTKLGNTLENESWAITNQSDLLKKIITDGIFIDKGVCIFAQGVQTPREDINIQNINPNEGFQGGLLGSPVSYGRSPLEKFNIAFLETNISFIDFIIRPWVIYTAHYGLIARQPNDPKNIKTTLLVFFYDRGGNNAPKMRKIFRLFNAAPVSVESIISTWDNQEIKKVYTSWTYTHYDIITQQFANDIQTSIERTNIEANLINNAKQTFNSTLTPIKTKLTTIPSSLGSEVLSNPTSFNLPQPNFGIPGGIVPGGSFTP